MANGKSDIQTAREAHLLHGAVNGSKREQELVFAAYTVTLLGTEGNGEYHVLDAQLPAENLRLVPELSRIRKISGTYNMTTLLKRVAADGTLSDLTTTSGGYTGGGTLTFAPVDALALPVLGKTDGIRLYFPAVTTTNAGAQFEVELCFRRQR